MEEEYNVRVRHPNSVVYREVFARRSEDARKVLAAHFDLPYGQTARETLDLFPAGASSPIVIFVHGGYWHAHDKRDFSFVAGPLVAAGIGVAIVNYGHAPQVPVGTIIDQIGTACTWLRRHVARFGGDRDRLFIAGHSAGAHLAAAAALATEGRVYGIHDDLLKGACLVSGLYDLEPLMSTSLNANIGLTPRTARLWSPLHHIGPSAVRLLIAVGELESEAFLGQSKAYLRQWQAAGNTAEGMLLTGAHHYEAMLAFDDPGSDLVRRFVSLIG